MMILGYFLTVLLMKAYNGDANHLKPKSFRQNQLNRIHSTINSLIKFSLVKSSIDPVFAATDNDLLSLEQAITTTKPVIANSDKLFAFDDVDMAANFIETNCKQLLQFVNQTGRLLYRGDESLSIYNPRLIALKPDLLSPYTYSAAAADYFQVLDSSIDSPTAVKPSRGHLSVSSSMRASQWGPVYSIWPLDRFHYAWLSSGDVWWDDAWGTPQNPRGPFFWRRKESLQAMLREEVIADTYLDGALQKESEVMLSSDLSDNGVESMFAGLQAFTAKFPHISTQSSVLKDKALFRQAVTTQGQLFAVAIPVIKESQLLDRLRIVPYSTQVPVRRAAPMEAEDVRFVKNYAPPLRDEFNDSSGRITKS